MKVILKAFLLSRPTMVKALTSAVAMVPITMVLVVPSTTGQVPTTMVEVVTITMDAPVRTTMAEVAATTMDVPVRTTMAEVAATTMDVLTMLKQTNLTGLQIKSRILTQKPLRITTPRMILLLYSMVTTVRTAFLETTTVLPTAILG